MAYTTKKLLADSLKKLLMQKTLDRITVKEICAEAKVNRQTFYYNFHDIYDLMDWILREELERVFKPEETAKAWQEGIDSIFEYVRENRRFISNAFHSVTRAALENHLKQRFRPIIREVIDERSKGIAISDENKEFITDVYAMALIGIMYEWIEGGMEKEYRNKLDKLKILINGSLDYLIEKFSY